MKLYNIIVVVIILLVFSALLWAQSDSQIANIKGKRHNAPAIRDALETVQDSVETFSDSLKSYDLLIKAIYDSLELHKTILDSLGAS